MKLSELNIGDKFSIKQDYEGEFLSGNYVKINPNTDNFYICHNDKYFILNNYVFVLNLDTSTLGILLLTQEVTLND